MDAAFDDKYILKHGALEQEFEELHADVEEVSNQLRKAKEAKSVLQAEVRFLKKRAKMLKELSSSKPVWMMRELCYSKDPAMESRRFVSPSSNIVLGGRKPPESAVDSFSKQSRQYLHSPQVQGFAQPPSKHKNVVGVLKKAPIEKVNLNNIPQAKKAGKRKISWQDEYLVRA